MPQHLVDPSALGAALALRDLTEPARGPHAMQQLVHLAVSSLQAEWGCPVLVIRSCPLTTTEDNYERLGYPPDAAARDARYTRYVDPRTVLRTHASAMIPAALRLVAAAGYPDVLVVCVGLVYRRDRIDRQSVGEPHQMDLWRVRRGRLDAGDLTRMAGLVLGAALPGVDTRAEPTSHPYTGRGRELQARGDGRWVEVGECGLARRRVLAASGLTGPEWRGLAMGLGLDRLLMVRKRITDIRLLRSDDERVAAQMLDLSPYRPVSSAPPVHRDLSLALDGVPTSEELGDRVRESLGADAVSVEAVQVLGETPASELPEAAVERLGIGPDQRNLLVRITLRHPTRTMTAGEANRIRDRVYAALHRGRAHQWAGGGPPGA